MLTTDNKKKCTNGKNGVAIATADGGDFEMFICATIENKIREIIYSTPSNSAVYCHYTVKHNPLAFTSAKIKVSHFLPKTCTEPVKIAVDWLVMKVMTKTMAIVILLKTIIMISQ